MIPFDTTTAARVRFTLSCLQEGVRRGRAKAKTDRLNAQHLANTSARWQG